jgi:hypothetical protein
MRGLGDDFAERYPALGLAGAQAGEPGKDVPTAVQLLEGLNLRVLGAGKIQEIADGAMVCAGISLPALMQSMGHGHISTTIIYAQISLPATSLNNAPARWRNRSGRPCLSHYEPAASSPASPGCAVSARRPIAHHLPQPGDDSLLPLAG